MPHSANFIFCAQTNSTQFRFNHLLSCLHFNSVLFHVPKCFHFYHFHLLLRLSSAFKRDFQKRHSFGEFDYGQLWQLFGKVLSVAFFQVFLNYLCVIPLSRVLFSVRCAFLLDTSGGTSTYTLFRLCLSG